MTGAHEQLAQSRSLRSRTPTGYPTRDLLNTNASPRHWPPYISRNDVSVSSILFEFDRWTNKRTNKINQTVINSLIQLSCWL